MLGPKPGPNSSETRRFSDITLSHTGGALTWSNGACDMTASHNLEIVHSRLLLPEGG